MRAREISHDLCPVELQRIPKKSQIRDEKRHTRALRFALVSDMANILGHTNILSIGLGYDLNLKGAKRRFNHACHPDHTREF